MKNISNEKEYLEIKKYDIDNLFKKLILLIKKEYLKYTEIDEILYKLLINYKIKPTYIINKISLLNLDDIKIKKIYNLNYDYNIKLQNTSKYIIYIQSYIYDLNNILFNN